MDTGTEPVLHIDALRAEMDRINTALLGLFVERMRTAQQIGRYKKARGLPVLDPAREAAILDAMGERAPEALREYVRPFFQCMMDLAKQAEEQEG